MCENGARVDLWEVKDGRRTQFGSTTPRGGRTAGCSPKGQVRRFSGSCRTGLPCDPTLASPFWLQHADRRLQSGTHHHPRLEGRIEALGKVRSPHICPTSENLPSTHS